ncbi:MAG TPA: class I lanthipeptide, partial [Chitinophagaceae bacterium]|nr:class I lanthipeptide [Chitinophagaceae bacterium]
RLPLAPLLTNINHLGMKKKIISNRLQLQKKTITNLNTGDQANILGGDLGLGLGSNKNSCLEQTKAGNSSPCNNNTCKGETCVYLNGC